MSATQEYWLYNERGTRVCIDPLGAALRQVWTMDRMGNFSNIALCTLPPAAPAFDDSYAGVTLAPCAGRVPEGRLCLDGQTVRLTRNDGKNHLHGGSLSFARWQGETPTRDGEGMHCTLSVFAPDGLDGYPGDRYFTVTYTLTEDDQLLIRYRAATSQTTWVNLCSHAYWNLSGDFTRSANRQRLRIAAGNVYHNDMAHLPISRHPVAGTAFDFRSPRRLLEQINGFSAEPQLAIARGYNHTFVLDGSAPAATLTDEDTGRRLRLYTDYPALVFYGGGYLHEGIALAGGLAAFPCCALALEAQELPGTEAPLLRPGEERGRFIRFAFDTLT